MQSVFITGGSTGIGLELAKLYAAHDYKVGICARSPDKLPNNFQHDHPNILFFTADVTSKISVANAVREFLQTIDAELNIMIANAGRSTGSKMQLPAFNVVENVINTNLYGVLNTFAIATEIFLKQQHGQLVSIASVAGMVGLPGAAAYSASKAAVLALGESLALDLPKYGITVTTIAPGFIDTPLTQKNDHGMPFMMTASKAAVKIKRAIDKKVALYVFPWQMHLLITIAKIMPRCCYRFLMRSRLLNYSRGL